MMGNGSGAEKRASRGKFISALPVEGMSERHRDVLEAAAALFAERGYAATSVRDIGERVGLLGGSLYHYIKSKEALFVNIHDMALQVAEDRINAAVAPHEDPWRRLEAACIAMLEIQLDPESLTMPLMSDFNSVPPEIRVSLVSKRDKFEDIFRGLIAALPLAPGLNRNVYRLLLLTLLNNVSGWYRQGLLSPAEIGQQIMHIFRHDGSAGQ
ncbi:TetR/AcrR family transcriptional regulator [Kerstersia gyiorum]|uniref:TetR/AcrR family transcriptional regulator n=1 Tax=Kerstersia gyiorum TaxID=206506 RepID=UPI00242D706D|nr:TetR/AcrR family transcriptional regulator [Kerstersia gyiorum]MCH4272873.1 TetR/AcrR family transcriptional regulator [Kerstersia gyiorum]MCI1229132.1 TetR/AcrR family transcriptional regulator [Kerstersia gyiorum]